MPVTHRCIMCGDKAWCSYGPNEKLLCANAKCQIFGSTLVPYSETSGISNYLTVTTQEYPYNSISTQSCKPKEQDMCNSVKRWGVLIEPGNKSSDGSDTYYVRFDHKDKGTTDQLTRSFDTFEQALEFANKTYKELK